jgi:DNA-binding MarR family transcriptional regulator
MKGHRDAAENLVERLAEFRYRLRQFLHFSEQAAASAALQPQQHQLLLQVAGAPAGTLPTIAYAAERLGLRHNSVVELANRSVDEGLLERTSDEADARRVLLRVTARGTRVLHKLAAHHRSELEVMGPALIEALTAIASTASLDEQAALAAPEKGSGSARSRR